MLTADGVPRCFQWNTHLTGLVLCTATVNLCYGLFGSELQISLHFTAMLRVFTLKGGYIQFLTLCIHTLQRAKTVNPTLHSLKTAKNRLVNGKNTPGRPYRPRSLSLRSKRAALDLAFFRFVHYANRTFLGDRFGSHPAQH